jgi:hypothetical protein
MDENDPVVLVSEPLADVLETLDNLAGFGDGGAGVESCG